MSYSRRYSGEESCKRIVRRITSLPRNILEGCSRMMNQGVDLIRFGGRTNHHNHHIHNQPPLNFPFQNHPNNNNNNSNFHPREEWSSFSTSFERDYGTMHPFFYACRFKDVMKMARDERKFVFMYVHSPEHPFTSGFCRGTLCSEVVVHFLDANFVSWGGLSGGGEGSEMAAALGACTFPFCAVVAPASGDSIAVIQQIEGPVSPAELVEILQRTIEEQGVAFGSDDVAKHDETTSVDNQRLRDEQDVAYVTSLHVDQEKETLKKKPINAEAKANKAKPANISAQTSQKAAEATQILIRFPNGERRECSFLCTDKIRAIYVYVDSLGLIGVGNYRLISNFPRKVYGEDRMGTSLKECGLHPKASLFLELL
ncbi:hypothetical protein ABFS82_09G017200 [Erythranthe guttata]|uniref:plant UBX domain-containing protein 10-like n=1 Tax=Erythranthe guttata TaxID=4155 RepID=UPI00064DDBA0|nr:PREDICTED: plant UBX domain-containing protein 10-like [Erythranthe guttata]|eukprot:XP_012855615.1 PREDICTED: plant UBX domain-containing protein 10-like [Erythranthe guttata]